MRFVIEDALPAMLYGAMGEVSLQSPESKIPRAAWWAGNVAMRFETYDYAQPDFDIHQAIYERLALRGDELVVDVGAHTGTFLYYLKSKKHKGSLIGIEPEISRILPVRPHGTLRFYETLAKSLPGGDHSVDVLASNFMLYFGEDQDENLSEFERVLKPEGKLVVSTSGYFNKVRHRQFEQLIAEMYDIKPPPMMNQKFDTDIAADTLRERFRHVYHGSYDGKMVFNSQADSLAYYHSLMSMGSFFDPPLSDELLHGAYASIVAPIIQREIEQVGHFDDYIQRDFFICTNNSYSLWMYDPKVSTKVNVKGYQREELGNA